MSATLFQALSLLRQARERVAHGCPSLTLALAGPPYSTARHRLEQAEDSRHVSAEAPSWAEALTETVALVDEAREAWGKAPDVLPVASKQLPPCGSELRLFLPDARACAANALAWEDTGGLSRPQALCVVHLAVCLAMWRLREAQAELAAHQERERWKRDGEARAAAVAPLIWGTAAKSKVEERAKVPASLRELASVSRAFGDWGVDELASGGDSWHNEGEGTNTCE